MPWKKLAINTDTFPIYPACGPPTPILWTARFSCRSRSGHFCGDCKIAQFPKECINQKIYAIVKSSYSNKTFIYVFDDRSQKGDTIGLKPSLGRERGGAENRPRKGISHEIAPIVLHLRADDTGDKRQYDSSSRCGPVEVPKDMIGIFFRVWEKNRAWAGSESTRISGAGF